MTRTCEYCGAEFEPNPKHRGTQRYSSRSCANRGVARERHGAAPSARCEWCGRLFSPLRENNRFCSNDCRLAAAYKRKGRGRGEGEGEGEGEDARKIARVRAYLALSPAERWAKRSTLTKAELALAAKMYDEAHSHRAVEWNWLPH